MQLGFPKTTRVFGRRDIVRSAEAGRKFSARVSRKDKWPVVGGEGLEPPEAERPSRLQRDVIAAIRTAQFLNCLFILSV